MINYPNPCDKCPKDAQYCGSCTLYRTCDKWRAWFLWHWKQFNLYAKKHGIEPTTPPEPENKEEISSEKRNLCSESQQE